METPSQVDVSAEIELLRAMIRRQVVEGASAATIARAVQSLRGLVGVSRAGDTIDSVLARVVEEIAAEVRG